MSEKTSQNRLLQFTAYAIVATFVLGFFISSIGAWTGPILAAWFIGTQKPWRGFFLLACLTILLNLISGLFTFLLTGMVPSGWTLLGTVISLLPFLLYRLTTQHRQEFVTTLSLPLWGVALQGLGPLVLPPAIFRLYSNAQIHSAVAPLPHISAVLGAGAALFLVYWFAATLIWMWNREFRAKDIATGAGIFAAACLLVLGDVFFQEILHAAPPDTLVTRHVFAWICFAAGLILTTWGVLWPGTRREVWAKKTDTVALLRSPYTGTSLRVASEGGKEILVSQSGERFPIRNGIPIFLEPEKLTGSNKKYNHLYETIGGFYDDIQRVACALRGVNPGDYFWSYLRFLEIKLGDFVLETSVGTGLNYKYLPEGVKRFGLDLSPEMLAACQVNLLRWNLDADLFQGNAEDLPFADNSFDVVYHVGGINFFNDRANAIREMIRVAKPGTCIVIADETEEHVQKTYEQFPVVGAYFRNRHEAVSAPVDLVPPEMQEIQLELLREGKFYALLFRKPFSTVRNPGNSQPIG